MNKNKNKNEIFQPIYTKAQAIKTNINEENIIKDKLVEETLSNEKKIKFKHSPEVLKEKKMI
jgi:hypothetical protein